MERVKCLEGYAIMLVGSLVKYKIVESGMSDVRGHPPIRKRPNSPIHLLLFFRADCCSPFSLRLGLSIGELC